MGSTEEKTKLVGMRSPDPLGEASLLSKFFFKWPYRVLALGMQRPLVEQDLPHLPHVNTSAVCREFLNELWNKELEAHPDKPSLHRAILRDYCKSLWYVQPLMLLSTIAKVVQALALGFLVQTFDADQNDNGNGYVWAAVLVFTAAVVMVEHHHVFFFTMHKAMKLRAAAVACIYDKTTRLPSVASTDTDGSAITTGNVMNLASNDVERFLLAALFVFYLFWAPAQSIAILFVGWKVLGPAFGAGFALLIFIVVPAQVYLAHNFSKLRSKIAVITDKRVTLVSQAVLGVRVMKMNGWEHQFEERINIIRNQEVQQIKKANGLKALNEALFFSTGVVTAIVVFIVHVFTGGILTTRVVFTTLSLINIVQIEMTKHLSLGVMGVSEAYVSIQRIQTFFEYPELEQENGNKSPLDNTDETCEERGTGTRGEEKAKQVHPVQLENIVVEDLSEDALSLSNVNCYWNDTTPKKKLADSREKSNSDNDDESITSRLLVIALDDITLKFPRKELTCIIGTVGSGKSALLQALVGELPVHSGTLNRNYDSCAYASQDPWIMDGTVKENIILGLDFDSDYYLEVVKACCLDIDFLQFQNGDHTIVGDRGVQCSGGQRARIGLARALYRNADLLVLDDPLSAVDAKVGRILFNEAILGLGINRGKSVVLATHQHQYIGDYRCVLMSAGKLGCVGSYRECVTTSNGKLTSHTPDDSADKLAGSAGPEPGAIEKIDRADAPQEVGGDNSTVTEMTIDGNSQNDSEELNTTGVVRFNTFLNYARAMGGVWFGVGLLIYFALAQAAALITVVTIGKWAERPVDEQKSWDILGTVIGLGCSVVFLATTRALWCFRSTVKASQRLHDRMTASVLRAKISFFDTNPMGRILNRFSADVGSNDDLLPHTLFDFLMVAGICIGGVITAVSVLPFVLVVIPPLLWYFLRVRRIFVTCTRELKRLEGLARSPIFAMLSESMSGVATIRSNNALVYFRKKFERVHDCHSRAYFSFIASARWVGLRMDSMMVFFLAVCSFLSVLVNQQGWFNVDPAVLGLSLTMLVQLAAIFQWCIRQSAEVVNQMVGVERVVAFGDLPSEAALIKDEPDSALCANGWPHEGSIELKDFSVRYRDSLPLTLKNVSFRIEPGHRVGIVGRTGSGKSTLVQSLFRLVEAQSGSIMIDGVDISRLGLHTLRTNMSVIPQFPVLFSGCTVRENLDPFSKYSDNDIHLALQDVHMDEVLEELPLGWNSMVSEGGSNFSVGQRQLLCLARAIICKNKILLLDEPTANVDSRTDELLQEALHKSFKGSTILSVAHRLDTVIDHDRILVLGNGELLEYGSPAKLLENPDGHLSSMVRDTGESMSRELHNRVKTRGK